MNTTNLQIELSICICTYKRPLLLNNCLQHLLKQKTSRSMEIIVIDNDIHCTAKEIVKSAMKVIKGNVKYIKYEVEPIQNISLARNKALTLSVGKYIVFIDDDEYPLKEDWIERHISTLEKYNVDGTLGPVVNIYPTKAPEWQKIPRMPIPGFWQTGKEISKPMGIGNFALSREFLLKSKVFFNPNYGLTGGEDAEFMSRLLHRGAKFIWCDEAIVCQLIEEKKLSLKYNIKRYLQFGINTTQILVTQKGVVRALIELPIRIIFSTRKTFLYCLISIQSPKKALFIFFTEMLVNLGKLLYFFKKKFFIYK